MTPVTFVRHPPSRDRRLRMLLLTVRGTCGRNGSAEGVLFLSWPQRGCLCGTPFVVSHRVTTPLCYIVCVLIFVIGTDSGRGLLLSFRSNTSVGLRLMCTSLSPSVL